MSSLPSPATAASFLPAFRQAIQRLRGALTVLYGSIDAEVGAPQQVARRLGINRNLSWKVARIIQTADPLRAYSSLPGSEGFRIVLDGCDRAGAPKGAQEAVRAAHEEYLSVVQRHAGDRATLELMLAHAGDQADTGPLSETGRKLAFQGNSAIWGVQARVRMLSQIVTPNREDADKLDIALVGGVFGYHRLRSGVTWPIGQLMRHGADSQERAPEPIDEEQQAATGIPLMREFCSTPIPPLRSFDEGEVQITELAEGPVGKTGALSCVFGWIQRAYSSAWWEQDDPYNEHVLRLETPAEVAVLDLMVHRDLPYELPPSFCIYSLMHGRRAFPVCVNERHHLPHSEQVESLGSGSLGLANRHVPRLPEMIGVATQRLGHDLAAFRGYRVTLNYPPIPTFAVMWYEKPRRTS